LTTSGADDSAQLFLYPGDRHLFADNSLSDYDEGAATLLKQRVSSSSTTSSSDQNSVGRQESAR
jgi:hypothetical protein